ncbi:MAG: VacJ family lipoprotein [Glaciecola sp.]
MKQSAVILTLCVMFLSGCASTDKPSETPKQNVQTGDPRDPLEGFNRVMWDFNYNYLDKFLVKPLAQGYVLVTPKPVRQGLVNAAENLEEPANFVNNALQGKVDGMMTSLARFLVNSTVGVFGIFDVAKAMELEAKEEDFGQTLGVYGLETGPYLMVPARGPTDIRSTSGDIVDGMMFPMNILDSNIRVLSFVIKGLDARANLLEQEGTLNNSLDPYGFVKNAYFQRLEYDVKDGNVETDDEAFLDEFDDIEEMLDEQD